MNNEIIIGETYSSILHTNTNIDTLRHNEDYNENKEVIHKPISRKRTIRTDDLFNSLTNEFTSQNEILPSGCKYYQPLGNGYKVLVVEEPPRIRTIKADIGMESTIEKLRITGKLKEYGYENYLEENKGKYPAFQLSFPYVVFIILLNGDNQLINIKPFFRLQPITGLADYLFKAPLYNIPRSQSICLGGVESFENIFESINNIIEVFWLNRYNNDYTNNIEEYDRNDAYEIKDYLTWMYFSKVNPMFIYNVNWIKYKNNIGQVIDQIKHDYPEYFHNKNSSSYDIFHNALFDSTSVELNPERSSKNTSYNIIFNGDNISVGDEILFEDKTYYLYSIVTKDDGYTYDSIELEDSDGVLIKVPFDDFEDGYKSIYKPKFLEEANINGTTIKPGTIINCKFGNYNMYKKIKSIRKALDGKIEAAVGNDHYLIENIDFEIVDVSKILINGKSLSDKSTYNLITNNRGGYNPSSKLIEAKFTGIQFKNTSGTFVLEFKTEDGQNININFNDYEKGISNYNFIESNKIEDYDVICYFDKILYNFTESRFKIIKNKGICYESRSNLRQYIPTTNHVDDIYKKILIENKSRLFIPRISNDIDFKVGDPITYINWETPEDMLIISSIDKFELDKENNILYICSTSINKKNSYRIPYVDLNKYRVNIGVVRKVESQFGEWKSGDKIKANTTGIINFPKKDTNTIIAFINDGETKYPLALCSNLCTLWMNEETINKFDLISLKSDKWPKFDNAPINIEKINWQHGDQFTNKSSTLFPLIKFLARRRSTRFSFEYHYIENLGGIEWGTNITKNDLNQYYVRQGILMPRISVTKITSAKNKTGYPNMLGGYILDKDSNIFFRSEQFKEDF